MSTLDLNKVPSIYIALQVIVPALFFALGLSYGSRYHSLSTKLVREARMCKTFTQETSNRTLTGVSAAYQEEKYADIGSSPFSCNVMRGYQELSRLHERSVQLTKHMKKGEANRDRTATIIRKQGNAMAAEGAFRKCVGDLIPELLAKWDEDLKKGLKLYTWDEKKEKDIDGISFEILEETAASLD